MNWILTNDWKMLSKSKITTHKQANNQTLKVKHKACKNQTWNYRHTIPSVRRASLETPKHLIIKKVRPKLNIADYANLRRDNLTRRA